MSLRSARGSRHAWGRGRTFLQPVTRAGVSGPDGGPEDGAFAGESGAFARRDVRGLTTGQDVVGPVGPVRSAGLVRPVRFRRRVGVRRAHPDPAAGAQEDLRGAAFEDAG